MSKAIFVNLPVADLDRSTQFYEAIGCTRNAQFSDHKASSMVWSEHITFQLLAREYFAGFVSRPVADARATAQVILCLSRDAREEVDGLVETAREAGAGATRARWSSSTSSTIALSRILTATFSRSSGSTSRPCLDRITSRRPPEARPQRCGVACRLLAPGHAASLSRVRCPYPQRTSSHRRRPHPCAFDNAILMALQKAARISNRDLSGQIGLSESACHAARASGLPDSKRAACSGRANNKEPRDACCGEACERDARRNRWSDHLCSLPCS